VLPCFFVYKNTIFYSLFKDFIVILQKKKTVMTQEEQLKKDEQYMRKALVEAQQAYDEGEIPVGAVIVCNDRIISRAHNLTETLCDVTAHAEMQAITSAANMIGGKYLTNCTLYVTVEPCPMCAGAIGWAQIPRIVFGATDEKRGYRVYAPNVLHPKAQVTSGILEEECAALMKEFFKSRR
jgi:tRNA(adenine34) deaminase